VKKTLDQREREALIRLVAQASSVYRKYQTNWRRHRTVQIEKMGNTLAVLDRIRKERSGAASAPAVGTEGER